jgi:DNA invertase Pin-like site-specific DNA recombinase
MLFLGKLKGMSKHYAVYMRVGTRRQDRASQEPELQRWGDANGGETCWYHDTYTSTYMDRPVFRQLLRKMETGLVDTLVVWRLNRSGRTAKGLTDLTEDLVTRNVNLVSLKDGLDLSTAAGRLMANVLASVAAYEAEVRAERIRAGQVVARAAGKHLGRPAGIRTPAKVTREQDTLVRRMRSQGEPIASIARATGLSRGLCIGFSTEPPHPGSECRSGLGRCRRAQVESIGRPLPMSIDRRSRLEASP